MMRLRERELIEAGLIHRLEKTGTLGSRPEAFSDERIPFRASLLPDGGQLRVGERGLTGGGRIRLLADRGLSAKAGDGVYVGEEFFVIASVRRWTAHIELECEARA